MEGWFLAAIPLVSVLSGVLTVGAIAALGGLGVIRALHRRIVLVEERIEDTDQRITREVKRRAADKALDSRQSSPKAQAEAYIATHPDQGPQPGQKPSIINRLGNR